MPPTCTCAMAQQLSAPAGARSFRLRNRRALPRDPHVGGTRRGDGRRRRPHRPPGIPRASPGRAESGAFDARRIAVEQPRDPRCFTSQEMRTWFKPLGEIRVDRPPSPGELPQDLFAGPLYTTVPGAFPPGDQLSLHLSLGRLEHGLPAALWDDQPLERYGQSVLPLAQPLFSGVHFFATFAVIPYEIGLDGTHDLIYTLGYYRPGDRVPLPRGSGCPSSGTPRSIEAGTMTGLIFLAP